MWQAVVDARDAASELVIDRFSRGEPVQGWEVDDASRNEVRAAGYGDHFIHRTGHSIGHEVHGNGANIDNFETRDSRLILPGTCFSIEPGIYLPDRMAVRTEIDVLVSPDGVAEVSGPVQQELIHIV
jgi:Xaa-Pro aminopeptidase